MSLTQTIQATAAADRIRWRYHALQRAQERGISRDQAKRVIRKGDIVEQDSAARPFPKYLMMAEGAPHKPLYVALGYDPADNYVYVITVHWLDPRTRAG